MLKIFKTKQETSTDFFKKRKCHPRPTDSESLGMRNKASALKKQKKQQNCQLIVICGEIKETYI